MNSGTYFFFFKVLISNRIKSNIVLNILILTEQKIIFLVYNDSFIINLSTLLDFNIKYFEQKLNDRYYEKFSTK